MGVIQIKVFGSNGKGVKARFGGQVSGPLGGHVSGGYTDSDGNGVLEWSGDSDLDTIYIDGKGHKGKYRSGSTHDFQR